MSTITIKSTPAKASSRDRYAGDIVAKLTGIGCYSATAASGVMTLTHNGAVVPFFRVSPVARKTANAGFLDFLDKNPSDGLLSLARNHFQLGKPTSKCLAAFQKKLNDPQYALPEKLEMLKSAFSQIEPRNLRPFMGKVVLPWFFGNYSKGRVLAVTVCDVGNDYEYIFRNLVATTYYGFDVHEADPGRRKPFNSFMPSFTSRIINLVRMCSQYNGPYLDAFAVDGIFSVFVFIPDQSIHRRSLHKCGLFDCIAPFSSVTSEAEVYQDGGLQDTLPSIHPPRKAIETERWLRYWLDRANTALNRLYNLDAAQDTGGHVSLDTYSRNILQFDRVVFESAWATAQLDQFIRKVLTYAVCDKILHFMRPTWGKNDFEQFSSIFRKHFLATRLPALMKEPFLAAQAPAWLGRIQSQIVKTAVDAGYPGNLITTGGLNPTLPTHLAGVFGKTATAVSAEDYTGNVLRAIRNTHHGFSALNPNPFAALTTTCGVVSDYICLVAPFFTFAMLEDVDLALNSGW